MGMTMRIIKFIRMRLKMLIDRFLLNTDYDTQKEQNVVNIELKLTARTFPASGSERLVILQTTSTDLATLSFETPMILCDYFPDVVLFGDDPIYDNGEIEFSFYLWKDENRHYKFKMRAINYSGHSVQTPDITFTAHIHQFVPSTQED